jgi:hypothetical protein
MAQALSLAVGQQGLLLAVVSCQRAARTLFLTIAAAALQLPCRDICRARLAELAIARSRLVLSQGSGFTTVAGFERYVADAGSVR